MGPLLSCALLTLLVETAHAVTWTLSGPQSTLSWSYTGSNGPEYWSKLGYHICDGIRQSPVDLDACHATQQKFAPLLLKGFRTPPLAMNITNEYVTARMDPIWREKPPQVSGGDLPGTFYVYQIHLHWGQNDTVGSEHTVNGHRYPLEMHIVCKNVKYQTLDEALTNVDGFAVLAVFFELDKPRDFGRGLISLSPALSTIQEGGSHAVVANPPSLLRLMPVNFNRFFRYQGSLTTPSCFEVVSWVVLLETVKIIDVELKLLRSLLTTNDLPVGNNFRPVQHLNARKVQVHTALDACRGRGAGRLRSG